TWKWHAPKKVAPKHSIPSREPPTPRESVSKSHARREFQFHSAGIREGQKTPPCPRLPHRPRLPNLALLKRSPPICLPPRPEMDAVQARSNKEEANSSRISRPFRSLIRGT